MAPVVAIVNSSDIVHADSGRHECGPYDEYPHYIFIVLCRVSGE
jgi:hypothetical protein